MSLDTFLQSNVPGLDYPTIRPTLNLNFAKTKTLDPRITYSRNSIGTYVGSDGLIKTAVANEPRFDYDPVTGECLGLLLETSRTNLALWSENYNTSSWSSGYSRISNATISPNGIINGTEVKFGYYGTLSQQITISSITQITLSAWIKKIPGYDYTPTGADMGSGGKLLRFMASKGANQKNSVISGTNISETWYRYTWTVSLDETGNWDIGFVSANPSGYHFYLWGFQCEVGDYATSYIPTSGSTVTRQADIANITGTNFSSWYNSSKEGTLYFDTTLKSEFEDVPNLMIVALSTGGGFISNVVGLWGSAGNRYFDTVGYNNPGTSWIWGINNYFNYSINPSSKNKYAVGFKVGTSSSNLAINGTLLGSKNTTFNNVSGLYFGTNGVSQTISRITYYPKRLPDYQLQLLTK